ncbi:MAG: hypothetical protein ACKVPX_07930 [Myxococcaceae bacterium]
MTPSVWTALVATLLSAGADRPPSVEDKETYFGGVTAPAVLPAGSTSAYVSLGLTEVLGGFRQGFGIAELELRGRADWRAVSLALEALVKISALEQGRWEVAPFAGVGLALNSGARYLDAANIPYLAIRALGGLTTTYRAADTLYIVGQLEMTLDIGTSPAGVARFTPLAGGGIELYLTDALSFSAIGLLGVDVLRPEPAETLLRLGYGLRIGLGFRLF